MLGNVCVPESAAPFCYEFAKENKMLNSAKSDHVGTFSRARNIRAKFLRQFGRDEDGTILVMALLLLVIMLVLGGMAVDFMRFESRRALLQSVSDRAVLAAAELDQTLDAKEVVVDYFKKAGFEGSIVGEPVIGGNGVDSRSVGVTAQFELNTFYLRFIGIDQLEAPAQSAAIEGVGAVEISLIVDVSGSMYTEVSDVDVPSISACDGPMDPPAPTTKGSMRKIDILQEAACNFVNKLIIPEYDDQISISLVPYSEHVNIGDDLFDAIKTTNPLIVDPPKYDGSQESFTNPALCVEIPDAEFLTTEFNDTITYRQVESWQSNQHGYGGWEGTPGTRDYKIGALDQPLCPNNVNEQIIPISQDANALRTAIDGLRPRGGTAIFQGLKWGVTLLDSSFQTTIASLPGGVIDNAFANTRPAKYRTKDPASTTVKYVVLMTDGQNSDSSRVDHDDHYDTAQMVRLFNTYNFPFLWYTANYQSNALSAELNNIPGKPFNGGYSTVRTGLLSSDLAYTADSADTLMQNMCTAARDQGITIFTIAMAAETHGQNEMRECASLPQFYFETEGGSLVKIFEQIADQITDLRLSL